MDLGCVGQSGASQAEQQALLQQQRQRQQELVQLEGELQYNEVLIEERDEAIQEISHQIGEVHEIFQVGPLPCQLWLAMLRVGPICCCDRA